MEEELKMAEDLCAWYKCGQLYKWKGVDSLSMFINLKLKEVELFNMLVDDKVRGALFHTYFMDNLLLLAKQYNIKIDLNLIHVLKSILQFCQQRKHIMCNNVRIAGPYSMDPYIVFPNVSGEIDNYEPFQPGWIRVGDSVFQGDFTIGTGLGYHFEIIGNSMNKIREFIQNNFRWANVLVECF